MHYRKMTKNYIFRKFECELSKKETAELCFKTVRTVTGWDNGKEIPPECRRLMRMAKCRELSQFPCWAQFKMKHGKLELPTGQLVTPQEILTGIALIQIRSETEIKATTALIKLARAISDIKQKRLK
ncbi:regulator [Vibrio fluvialis]